MDGKIYHSLENNIYSELKYFLTNLNEKKPINTILEYRAVTDIHFKLTELFELQLED